MYINRTIETSLLKLSNQFKVVFVSGARQVGKSTLLRYCDSKRNYVSLDDHMERQLALEDPVLFLQKHQPPLIIDEIQYAPNILSYIKIAVDNSKEKGRYWLTGSQQFHLMKNLSDSLAGRVVILDLLGLSLKEQDLKQQIPFLPTKDFIEKMRADSKKHDLMDIYKIIWRGSYPELNSNPDLDWKLFYKSYLNTYIQRDIKDLNAVKNEMDFFKFLKRLAVRTSQVLNYSSISQELGISVPTIKSWVSILVSSNIIYLLQPYYSNLNKRLIKSPKVYFLDTGLCSYLSLWDNPDLLESGAMSGAMLETFVVSEILKSYYHNGSEEGIYYYRDKEKKEIDLIIEKNGKLYPVEIKKTASPNRLDVKNFSLLPQDQLGQGALVCLVSQDYPLDKNINAIPVSYI